MTDFTFWMLVSIIAGADAIREVLPFLALAILALYVPPLMTTRLLFHLRRRKGPIMRFLSYPIGPSIPGPDADGSALRHALKRWAVLCLKTVPLALASAFALLGVMAGGWLTIASVIAMGAALSAFVVSGVECVFLLVRVVLRRPRNPADSQLIPGNLEPPDDRGNSDGQSPPAFITRAPRHPASGRGVAVFRA